MIPNKIFISVIFLYICYFYKCGII
jgi:hypothetical protein